MVLLVGLAPINPTMWKAMGRSLGDGYLSELDATACESPDPRDAEGDLAPQAAGVAWWCYGTMDTAATAPEVSRLYVPDTDLPGIPDIWERYPLHSSALVVIHVEHLQDWIDAHPDERCESSVQLVFNGHGLDPLQPTLCDGPEGTILFQLHNLDLFEDDAHHGGWRALIDSRAHLTWTIANVTVAWRDEPPLRTAIRGEDAAIVILVSPSSALLSLTGALAGAALLWMFAISSTLLRVAGSTAAMPGPWSLRRVQAAWWFVVVFTSWEVLAAFTRDIPPIGTTSLLLLGIAGGTYSAQIVVPGVEDDAPPTTPKRGFLGDLVSDANGPVLHRVQLVVWSIALGIAFLYLSVSEVHMPELDPTLLGLMGLSAAGYLSGKTREAKADPT